MDKEALTSKADANYIKDGGDVPCAGCQNFLSSGACALVSGEISQKAPCDFYSLLRQNLLPTLLLYSLLLPDLMTQLFGGSNGQS